MYNYIYTTCRWIKISNIILCCISTHSSVWNMTAALRLMLLPVNWARRPLNILFGGLPVFLPGSILTGFLFLDLFVRGLLLSLLWFPAVRYRLGWWLYLSCPVHAKHFLLSYKKSICCWAWDGPRILQLLYVHKSYRTIYTNNMLHVLRFDTCSKAENDFYIHLYRKYVSKSLISRRRNLETPQQRRVVFESHYERR